MTERMLAELASEDQLVAAIAGLRERGYRELEAYVPYPSHAVDEALELEPSPLPWAVLAFGLAGAGGAYFLQWLLNAYLYPLDAGGRPPHFPLAFVPITFEMGVLIASLSAFVGTLIGGKLVRLVDGVQSVDGFGSASRDGFWIELSSADPLFDRERSRRELVELGARRVELSGGRP